MADFLSMPSTVGHNTGALDNLEYHLMARDPEYVNSASSRGLTPHPPSTPVHLSQYSQPPRQLNTLSSINASSTGSTNSASSSSSSTNCQTLHTTSNMVGTPNSPTVLLPPGQIGTQVIHIVHSNRNKTSRPSTSDVDEGSDDHDYYNDDYVRQVELLPLTRPPLNETTV